MGFLVAEVTIMLVVAAAAGAALAYWWVRHQFRDVTSEYRVLEAKLATSDHTLEQLNANGSESGRADQPVAASLEGRLSELQEAQNTRVRAIEGQLRTLSRQLQEALPHPMDAEDLARRLDTLRAAMPQPRLGSVEARLSRLETMIAAVCEQVGAEVPPSTSQYPSAPSTGTSRPPPSRPASVAPQAPKPRVASREPGANLLHKPAYGEPDDLKRISGVGAKLEALLHQLGVYYFWQVAEWTPRDIEFVDERLEAFKGRISRDGWVGQAKRFSSDPTASRGPSPSTSPGAVRSAS